MKKKISTILLTIIFLLTCSVSAFAHSGRTDSAGGHRDNKNASGLGYYHYHHGYGPHLHPNGVCPYAAPAVAPATQQAAKPVVQEKVKVIINGEEKAFSPAPVIESGNVLVPLRAIFESMGASVTWDQATQTATAIKSDTAVVIKIGAAEATINGSKQSLSAPAKIINGQTMAPLRFVGEAFGGTVTWDSGARTAAISY